MISAFHWTCISFWVVLMQYSKTAGQSQALDGSGAPAAPPLAQEGVSGTTKEATRMASAERLEAALATEAAVASAGHELMRRADPDGWLGGSAEVHFYSLSQKRHLAGHLDG